jgi:hypothetical protein
VLASGVEECKQQVSRYNPVKGLFDSWLTPDLYREGRALL